MWLSSVVEVDLTKLQRAIKMVKRDSWLLFLSVIDYRKDRKNVKIMPRSSQNYIKTALQLHVHSLTIKTEMQQPHI
jgi:hypothetical protein